MARLTFVCAPHVPCIRGPRPVRRAARMTARTFQPASRVARAVVWFRLGDLRVLDHPGLEEACAGTSEALAPLLVCTPRSTEEEVVAAERLRAALRARGSELFLRFAEDEAQGVVEFATEFKAERVHVRRDVENRARAVISRVEREMDGIATIQTWGDETREWELEEAELLASIPSLYPKFQEWVNRVSGSFLASNVDFQPRIILPSCNSEASPASLSANCVRKSLSALPAEPQWQTFLEAFNHDSERAGIVRVPAQEAGDSTGAEEELEQDTNAEQLVLAFLNSAEEYEEPDFGRSFLSLFSQGSMSPRRMRELVIQYENQNGRLWRPVYRSGAKQILSFLDAREFSCLMATRDVSQRGTVDGVHSAKFWRWRGLLTRYVEEGVENAGNGKPPLLVVHGFGASSQHFTRSISLLKEHHHVFSVDLIGFGRSEKPPTAYTQHLWQCVIWEFVRDVIGRPVFVAGNSIGGYLSCAFASDAYGELCEGLVLINTAGKLEDAGEQAKSSSSSLRGLLGGLFQYTVKEWSTFRYFIGASLLRSLQGRVDKTLKLVYPTNPDAADENLAREIKRNSQDFGAAYVLASGFVLPPQRSLTQLLGKYNGPLLIYQGLLDPLNAAGDRAAKLAAAYPNGELVAVEAGHCPHEEVAEHFSEAIAGWMDRVCDLDDAANDPDTDPAARQIIPQTVQ